MNKLDETIQRLLWSEMKDSAEFRALLAGKGFSIVPTTPTQEMVTAAWAEKGQPGRGLSREIHEMISAAISAGTKGN
jgi:uncharacterized lipoprotein